MANKLSREEVAAQWLYANEYVPSRLSAKEFYAGLDQFQKSGLARMLRELDQAKPSRKERK
jgi:hypothetical protein